MSGTPSVRFRSWLVPGIDLSVFEYSARRMETALGRPVELDVVSDRSGPEDGDQDFGPGAVDFGWMCSTAFVRQTDVDLVGVAWVPDDRDSHGEPRYFSDLIVPHESPVTHVAALRGRRVACNDEASLSGFYALRFALEDVGLVMGRDVEAVLTGGHLRSLEEISAGTVDAAAVDSVTRCTHPGVGRVIARLGPFPTQPLVAGVHVSQDDQRLVRDFFLSDLDDEGRRVLESAGLVGFAAVSESDYLGVRGRLASASN